MYLLPAGRYGRTFYCTRTTYDIGQIAVGVQLTPKNITDEDENTFNAIIGLVKKKLKRKGRTTKERDVSRK